jgi:hypothetical protein
MFDLVRRIDNCNIIRGIVNTYLNGIDSGFPLCCILEFTFRSHIIYGRGSRMVSQFRPYRKVYDRDLGKYHNYYAACHLCYWRGLAYKPSKKKYWVCDTCHEILGVAVDRFTMRGSDEYSIPHTAQYPTHRSFTSMWVAIEKENEFERQWKTGYEKT